MEKYYSYLKRNNLSIKQHQIDGIQWCLDIETKGVVIDGQQVNSGILADEMGLGKTNQMIGLMLVNFKLHTLIVLPRSLVEQWETIFKTRMGHQPLIYNKRCELHDVLKSPIVLTTYGMISKKNNLFDIKWDRIIFDEAHHLRNRKTKNNLSATTLQSSHKWLVSGTPIQNGISDFYGLCSVIKISQSFFVNRKNMSVIIDKLVLKRTKLEVGIVLPEMKKTNIVVNWENEEERNMAEEFHANLAFSKINRVGNNINLHHFARLQKARQSCIDMSLLDKSLFETFQSKINKVIKIIVERKSNKTSKLVFCHFRSEIDKIKYLLEKENMVVMTFDGRTRQEDRLSIISRNDIDVLILQINTGCEGLNLQQFSEVYFVSPHWNPAVEDQAIARSYRIGQEKIVNVFSFHMEPFDVERKCQTMDRYIKHVQRNKRDDMGVFDHPDPDDTGPELLCADGESDNCAICLSSQHKYTSTCLECGHWFHKTCIKSWFEKSMSCPTCRHS